jgi:hypothetical protein
VKDMKNSKVDAYRKRLEELLRIQTDPDLVNAVRMLREELEGFGAPIDEDSLSQVAASLRDEVEARVRRVRDPYVLQADRRDWYVDAANGAIHWPALKEYLAREKGWDKDNIQSIGQSSRRVVQKLGDPKEAESDVRGLVVGYVQSGKTANMTAVIARAVDAGYNLVIVMAGMTDALRHQTQLRIEKDLYRRAPHNWHFLTQTNTYDADGRQLTSGEFVGHTGRKLPPLRRDVAMIAIIKKNAAPLNKLVDDITDTPAPTRNRLRALVIDDEADQASPNAAETDQQPAPINLAIRTLLKSLNSMSYVGYTATPFANVLINPWPEGVVDETGERLDELYPRDFIISLPRPEGYFGAEQIFGRDPTNAEDEEYDGLRIIHDVPTDDMTSLVPKSRDVDDFEATIVPSLATSLSWFVLTVATRLFRGHGSEHMSMLIHTSNRVAVHNETGRAVQDWIRDFQEGLAKPELLEELARLWERERSVIPRGEFENSLPDFKEISPWLESASERLEIAIENSPSEARLSYEGEPRAWIAIGGNILSRGITLNGLAVTYFLRASRQYDTLLQMGRWFGYREGYEDLVRLWLPEALQKNYRRLALVEHELRQEIEEYALRKATPLDFAVRIRTLPGLQITGRNKMRHAVIADMDFSGLHLQTIRFPKDNKVLLEKNWNAAGKLLSAIGFSDSQTVGHEIKRERIVAFLREYEIDESHRGFTSEWLEQFIEKNPEMLETWSVVLVQPSSGDRKVSEISLGPISSPSLVNRAPLVERRTDALVDIKALMSRADVLADLQQELLPDEPGWSSWGWPRLKKWREDQIGKIPLLLMYPIDRHSRKKEGSVSRTDMQMEHHILGIGIVLPEAIRSQQRARAVKFISVPLPERDPGEVFDDEDDADVDVND